MSTQLKLLIDYLNNDYPFFYGNRRINFVMACFASAFVLHTILVLQPAILLSHIRTGLINAAIAYSLITFTLFMLWCELPPRLLPKWFQQWNILKECILSISCITTMGVFNSLYVIFLGRPAIYFIPADIAMLFEAISITLLSGIIPLLLLTLFNFLYLEKRVKVAGAKAPISKKVQETSIVLKEGTETLRFDLDEVSLIESMGNYVKIYYTRSQTNKVAIVRVTMKYIEEILQSQRTLIRTHRSYFVNILHVGSTRKSNSGELNLCCSNLDKLIPVSRARRKELNDLLKLQNIL